METPLLILLILCQLSRVFSVVQDTFTEREDSSGQLFTVDTVFNVSTFSKIQCATRCLLQPPCLGFTVVPGSASGTCRGYSYHFNSSSPSVPAEGARTFFGWLRRTCDADSQCSEGVNTECAHGLCNCIPGYFYSVSTRRCVPNCAVNSLGSEFTMHRHVNVHGFNILNRTDLTVQQCLGLCLTHSNCHSVDYEPSSLTCWVNSAAGPSLVFYSSSDVYYQRYCA